MARIAMLLPNEEMYRQAHDVLQEMKLRLELMKVIETEHAVTEARQAIKQGAEILIARGLQATIIKQHTDIPVVEIVLTEQAMLEMLERAKRILEKPQPNIALVMFRNMACDMTGIGERCGVTVREYYVQNPELLRAAAVQAIEDRADLVIGGATVLEVADAAGLPSLFLSNTEDALATAIREALKLSQTFENGEWLSEKLDKGRKRRKEESFVNFSYCSGKMREAVELAELLSAADCPKLIVEPVGTLYHGLASAIHNHSRHSGEKLIIHDCQEGEDAYELLFGRNGKIQETGKGTLLLHRIEHLDRRSQKRLLELLFFRHVIAVAKTEALSECLIPELYMRLKAFEIRIPALSETPEELPLLIRECMSGLTEKYGKYHVLSREGESALSEFPWPGNRIQLESFLERLLLSAKSRSISAEQIRGLYQGLYAELEREAASCTEAAADFLENELEKLERERLKAAMEESFGSREKAARALHISRSTLWRKLKKYGLLG